MTTPAILGIGVGVAIAVAAGGTAYVAKDAEPGDMLYDLRASLYGDVSTDVDVEAHMEGAEAAHDEARALQNGGQLTASEHARLTAEYSAHVNAIAGRIAELEAAGDGETAMELRTKLREALRTNRDIFPTIEVNVGGSIDINASSDTSMDSDDESSDDDSWEDDASSAASSIFVQPSSPVTSA